MKKILPLAFIAVTVVLASCSKDDNDDNDTNYIEKLQGTWVLTEAYEGNSSGILTTLELTDCKKKKRKQSLRGIC
ncbi:MAG: hypothetical protein Q4G08_04890 [Capnocytophaga sp.]|nr:hypothetical protein [Capnocytophaga sp.]